VRLDLARLRFAGQTLAIGAVGVLAGLLLWRVTHEPPAPRVGDRAPAFALQRLNGAGTVSLASLRGKVVVLNFFASYCGPCKREAPALEKVWRDYRSRGVVVLGIDTDDSSSEARTFVSAHGVTYPTVGVASAGLAARYGTANLPTTYVLNRQGRVVGGQILGPVSDQPFSRDLSSYVHAALK
jgi:cytochrome c biogenesis protein CcmG/thiol:disulfide interchange protein DsbE